MKGCSCGTPSLATYHVFVVVGTDDTTDSHDGYYCAAHVPTESEVESRYPLTDDNGTWNLLEGPEITLLVNGDNRS